MIEPRKRKLGVVRLKKTLILVAGMPATGKTTMAEYLSKELNLPLVCKDHIKECMWERLRFDGSIQSESQKYGGLAYDMSFHFIETLMGAGISLIFESNFSADCPPKLLELICQYGYRVIAVLLDGDIEVVHRRFLQREQTEARHPGVRSGERFASLEAFVRRTGPCREFSYGDYLIRVDTTDFEAVPYEEILEEIRNYT